MLAANEALGRNSDPVELRPAFRVLRTHGCPKRRGGQGLIAILLTLRMTAAFQSMSSTGSCSNSFLFTYIAQGADRAARRLRQSSEASNGAIKQHIASGGMIAAVSVKRGYHLRIE